MKKIIVSLLLTISALFAADMAPNFNATTITGENVSMDSYLQSKKPTLVYFSASWCPICAKNWPSINEVYKTYGDKVNFISFSIDPTDTDEVLTKLAKKHNLDYPMVKGSPKVMVDFGVRGQATTVLVNSKGEIVFKESGHISLNEYKKLLDDLLANE